MASSSLTSSLVETMVIARTKLRRTRDHDGYVFHWTQTRVREQRNGSVLTDVYRAPLLGLEASSLAELKRKVSENAIREGVGAAEAARLCCLEG